jgi:NitT/TauT family transport system substrate-binding protein
MRNNNRSAMTILMAVLALLVAACSGGGSSGSSTSTGDAGATSDTVTLGFSAWPGWFPWQIAQEQGLFTKAGLHVNLTYFESYTDSLNALNAGKIDANCQTLGDTLASVPTTTRRVTTRSSPSRASTPSPTSRARRSE